MPRYRPDFETFQRLVRDGYGRIPVHRRLLSDTLTPPAAFALLAGDDGDAFLLESVTGGETVGRHSFIATDPVARFRSTGEGDPLAGLAAVLEGPRYFRDPDLPSFTGGAVGYAGYDLIRYYEPEKLAGPAGGPPDDRGLPDVHFALYDSLVAFDHIQKHLLVIAHAVVEEGADPRAAYERACRRCDEIAGRLAGPVPLAPAEVADAGPGELKVEASLSREAYMAAVERGLEYIRAGDIFQFVPSLRLRAESRARPLDVYRALRAINPSPFMFFLRTPDATLIGSSPEILCRVEDHPDRPGRRRVESRPLAGTRRRGATAAEDAALEAELRADPKDVAEHVMLVDLHRNDVGRVAEVGSVELREVLEVERYSHVMHLSSDVVGTLREDMSALDALRVSLPVGTVSGAPKIRAMQIIDEVEATRRGPYGGAVGYVDHAGNLDTCIALRTIVHTPHPSEPGVGLYDVQAGAGVVADSDPAAEHDECQQKAAALLRAVAAAERMRPDQGG